MPRDRQSKEMDRGEETCQSVLDGRQRVKEIDENCSRLDKHCVEIAAKLSGDRLEEMRERAVSVIPCGLGGEVPAGERGTAKGFHGRRHTRAWMGKPNRLSSRRTQVEG